MREIKFRCWYGGKMVHQDELIETKGIHPFFTRVDFILRHTNPMQFTGLKDKNGREIYERDFLKATDPYGENEKVFVVEFENGSYSIHWSSMFNGGDGDITTIGFAMDQDFTFEVIGNTYENPELLTNEQNPERSATRDDAQRAEAGKQKTPNQ